MGISYPIEFYAAVLRQNNVPLAVERIRYDGPLDIGQVLVKICYSGICGKQLEEIEGKMGQDKFLPHLLGHEGSGVVLAVGPGVTYVKPGNHVVIHWVKGRGINSNTPSFIDMNGNRINAGLVTTFSEISVISESRLTVIPKEYELKYACLLGCSVTTGIGSVINEANLKNYESVAVVGCGGVGLNAIQGAKLAHAYPVVAVDHNEQALKLAELLGASHVINASHAHDYVLNLTNANGVDVVIVAAGTSVALELGFRLAALGGRILMAGVPRKEESSSFNSLDIHRRKTLTGSSGGGITPHRDILSYLRLYKQGAISLDTLVEEVLDLSNINTAIHKFSSGVSVGRFIIKMN